mmetsp:Transcript_107765/g.313676  ORF Transcript_107765/g.313676 Transcript_107765/m.313676 type:complete len:214 (-) Transcript_107765:68-709(-)
MFVPIVNRVWVFDVVDAHDGWFAFRVLPASVELRLDICVLTRMGGHQADRVVRLAVPPGPHHRISVIRPTQSVADGPMALRLRLVRMSLSAVVVPPPRHLVDVPLRGAARERAVRSGVAVALPVFKRWLPFAVSDGRVGVGLATEVVHAPGGFVEPDGRVATLQIARRAHAVGALGRPTLRGRSARTTAVWVLEAALFVDVDYLRAAPVRARR